MAKFLGGWDNDPWKLCISFPSYLTSSMTGPLIVGDVLSFPPLHIFVDRQTLKNTQRSVKSRSKLKIVGFGQGCANRVEHGGHRDSAWARLRHRLLPHRPCCCRRHSPHRVRSTHVPVCIWICAVAADESVKSSVSLSVAACQDREILGKE